MASLSGTMDLDIASNSAAIKEAIRQSRAAAREEARRHSRALVNEAREARKAFYKAKREARKQNGKNKTSEQNLTEAMPDVIMSSTAGIKKQKYPLAERRGMGIFYRAAAPNFPRGAEMQDMTTEGALNVAGDGEGVEGEPKTAEASAEEYQSRKALSAAKKEARRLKMAKRKAFFNPSSTSGIINKNEKKPKKEIAQEWSDKLKKRVTGWSVENSVHIADSFEVEKQQEINIEYANAVLAARTTPEAEAIPVPTELIAPAPSPEAAIAPKEASGKFNKKAKRPRASIENQLSSALSRVDISSVIKEQMAIRAGIRKSQREPTKREKWQMEIKAQKKQEADQRANKREQALLDAAEALIAKVDWEREQKARRFRTRGIEGENLDEEVAALKAEQAEYAQRIDKPREEGKEEARQAYEEAAVEEGKVTEVDELAKMLDLVGMGRKHGN
ncbi:hypothetical protein NA56DRAFT_755963 [Hyaloscypha hepaticicola]|uniref:Uncharacterized protein n=1 Tax=Hyaloscypha hepaticicola TaxID=2082293 RepID=A0A2J6PGW4_9HELO|nr:hypothetical protein NA56DRAFT_755963 [Hyaloscypha hepaticicola]